MKTRTSDFLDTEAMAPAYSFQYAEGKRPAASDWRYVNAGGVPATWPTKAKRDRARARFTTRRSVDAALADLRRDGLLSKTSNEGTDR